MAYNSIKTLFSHDHIGEKLCNTYWRYALYSLPINVGVCTFSMIYHCWYRIAVITSQFPEIAYLIYNPSHFTYHCKKLTWQQTHICGLLYLQKDEEILGNVRLYTGALYPNRVQLRLNIDKKSNPLSCVRSNYWSMPQLQRWFSQTNVEVKAWMNAFIFNQGKRFNMITYFLGSGITYWNYDTLMEVQLLDINQFPGIHQFPHLSLDKKTPISQTISSNAFSSMKRFSSWLIFH